MPDYSNIPAAIRDEILADLSEKVKIATENAASHQLEARHYQEIADREVNYAARDGERARQWQAQLDFIRKAMPDAEAFERNQADIARDAESEASPTVNDMHAIFGEPVEGRDYTLIDAQPIVPRSLAEIEAEEAAELARDAESGADR